MLSLRHAAMISLLAATTAFATPPDPSNLRLDSSDGTVVSRSGDGNVLIVGVPNERRGVDVASPETGAVYVFRRSSDAWRLERRFVQDPGTPPAHYGFAAEVSEDGDTLLIGRETQGGTAEIWRRVNGEWSLSATIPEPAHETGCNRIRLSGDGKTVVRTCTRPPDYRVLQSFQAPAFALESEDQIFVDEGWYLADLTVDYCGKNRTWSAVGPDETRSTGKSRAWRSCVQ